MQKGKVSPYRWIILLAIVPIIISTEMMWLSLAPVSSIAEKFYGVSGMSIALFSMSYMLMFILFSIPASWVVDKFGYRYSLIFGATLTAVFGIARYIFADSFTIVLISQFIIAIGQPFLLNISTKVPANWFPISERSTAAGILIMAQYIGFAVPMVVAPLVAEKGGIPQVFGLFAIVATVSALLAIFLTKEKPKVAPPGPEVPAEDFSKQSFIRLYNNKAYRKVLIVCFVSIGVFNTILTLIEGILMPRGLTSAEAGSVGAVFVVAGIIGAAVLPLISDKLGKRMPLVLGAILLLVPLYLGLTFITGFTFLLVIAFVTGFVIMGVAPILFQHGSEVAYPIQEGTSLGVILLMGQISGVVFVWIFETLATQMQGIVLPMLLIVCITVLQIPMALSMKESNLESKGKELTP